MLSVIKQAIKRKSIKDIFTLQISSLIGRAIAIVASIIIARVLGPDSYGVYSLIFVFTGLVALADIGYSKVAIVTLPEAYINQDKKTILNTLSYLFKINFFIYLPIYILIIIFAPPITNYFYQDPQVGQLARLIIVVMLLTSFSSVLNLNLEAQRKMKHLMVIENLNVFLRSALGVGLLVAGMGLFGIVLGHTIAIIIITLISFTLYFYWSKKNAYIPSFLSIFKNIFRVSFRFNLKFSLSITLDSHIGKHLLNLPLTILGFIATPATVGFYKIGLGYMSLSTMFKAPISRLLNVKFPADKAKNPGLLKKNFNQSSLISGIIFFLILIPLVALAPWLIPLFYGQEYQPAVNTAYWFAGFFFLSGFSIGFGPIYRAVKRVHLSVIFNTARSALGFGIFALLYWGFKISALTSVLSFNLFMGLTPPLHYLYIKKFVLSKLKLQKYV